MHWRTWWLNDGSGLLSTEVILDASPAYIDATGRLTMADLAERLGVSASSIYHHLPGRAAIIEAPARTVGRGDRSTPAGRK